MAIFNLRKRVEGKHVYWKSNDIEFHPRFHKAMVKVYKTGYESDKAQLCCTITTLLGLIGLLISPFIGLWFAVVMLAIVLFVPWGELYLSLPIVNNYNGCDSPSWGFYFYGEGLKIPDTFVICKGKKTKHISLPWSYDWVRTSRMLKDGTWLHERKGDRKKGIDHDWWSETTQSKLWKETHDYTYILNSNEVQERKATIIVEQREWRPLWFRWTSLFAKIRTDIDVEFDQEIGERSGSWKGGCVGCSYDLHPDETPLECLRRMEKERKF